MRRNSRFLFLAACVLLVALACAGTASAAIPAGNTGWNWANPLPQGNTLESVEVSGGRVWAGGSTGTLMRSDDNGNSWVAVRTGLLDDIRIIEAISPNSVVFAGRCALRRSDDGGATVRRLAWGSSDDSCAAQIQAVSFPTPLIGYLLLTNGDVYASSDGGDNWNKRGLAPGSTAAGGSAAVGDITFESPSIGVLSVGNRIMQSVDAGATWTPVKTADSGAGKFEFEFISAMVGYAAGESLQVLKTVDGGATWNTLPGNLNAGSSGFTSFSCSSEQNCVGTSGPSSASMLRTTDGGSTWGPVNSLDNVLPLYAVRHVDASHIVAVGSAGRILLSADGGDTWNSPGLVADGAFRGIRADAPDSALLFGYDGLLARSTDAGQTWKKMDFTLGLTINDATALGTSKYFLITASGLVRSNDGGGTWDRVDLGTKARPKAVFAWRPSRVLLVMPKGLRVSKRGGSASKAVPGKTAKRAYTSVDGARSSVFVYGKRSIASSQDKGKTWSIVKTPRNAESINRLDMVDSKYGFLLDSRAELFITKNGGKKWKRIETTGANAASSMAFGDRKHGYLTDNTGRVLATADGGATWSRQYPYYDPAGGSTSLIAATGKLSASILVAGTNRVFTTTTGGRIGSSSRLTIAPSAKSARAGSVIRITGTLSPANGTERVAVLARVVNANGGTRWISQERTVSATGSFTTSWRIAASTEFIARWSGDAAHDGDAAPSVVVKLRK